MSKSFDIKALFGYTTVLWKQNTFRSDQLFRNLPYTRTTMIKTLRIPHRITLVSGKYSSSTPLTLRSYVQQSLKNSRTCMQIFKKKTPRFSA